MKEQRRTTRERVEDAASLMRRITLTSDELDDAEAILACLTACLHRRGFTLEDADWLIDLPMFAADLMALRRRRRRRNR